MQLNVAQESFIFASQTLYLTYINIQISQIISILMMDKSSINIFEVKPVRKDIGFKISAADVFNQFLYLGDEKGNIHSYPIRVGEADIIPKSQNQTTKSISKYKIDKILCYPQISMILVLTGESLFAVDSAFRKSEQLASKISDFAIQENFLKEGNQNSSVVAITRKKEGFVFVYNPNTKKLEDIRAKFSVSEVPSSIAYLNSYVVVANKKDYQSLNGNKAFALKKSPLAAKFPFVKAVGPNQILILSDDIGLLMSPEFQPRPKDNVLINRPVIQVTLAGNYCFVLCDNSLQVYLNYDKKFSLVQEIPINAAKGITNLRPFIYNKDDLYFLYEIPYETQIKSLLQKCRVDDAISLLIQNVGSDNEQKIQQLKINAVWPLLRKMQFDKIKQMIRGINFDIRELIILYPELVSLEISAIKGAKAAKTIATLIIQYISEKTQKNKDEETQLKKKSKLFLRQILEFKRELYLSEGNTNRVKKREFYVSKNSLINGRFDAVTAQEMLEIIDFTLIKWFFEMGMLRYLEEFLLNCTKIYCQKQFGELQDLFRKNPKLLEVPTLKPRLFAAFQKYDEAYENWQKVAESSTKDNVIKTACEEAVTLLDKFDDRNGLFDRMSWILRLRPEIAMNFFTMVPLNFIPPDEIIKKLEAQKQYKYLELYLETIVLNKNTEVEAYHTKLMLLYLDSLFDMHPKESKEEGRDQDFLEKLSKFRKLQKSSNAKYVSEPILNKIEKCEWLLEDQIYLYSKEKRHEDALRKYISKNMSKEAEKYCQMNGEQTLTIYFRMLLTMYKSFQSSKNNSALLLKKDILVFLKEHASSPELDPLVVLELIPDDWMLNDFEGVGGIYQFLESSITHTLHEKRTTYTAKHLSQMDLLNAQYNLVQAKRAYLRFTVKKKCCICNGHIADKVFVVYPNANVCHQGCVKKDKNTICPVTKQDFQKTFKY